MSKPHRKLPKELSPEEELKTKAVEMSFVLEMGEDKFWEQDVLDIIEQTETRYKQWDAIPGKWDRELAKLKDGSYLDPKEPLFKPEPAPKPEPVSAYYTLDNILKRNATYNVIFGERSNGKTYAALKLAIQNWVKDGSQMAYIRRWAEDTQGRRGASLFQALVDNGEIFDLTEGRFSGVHYFSKRWYLCNYDENGKPHYSDETCVAYAFALSAVEHDKSTSYPKINVIVFDEFLTKKTYLADEFVHFMNAVSTIVRRRDNVKIFMLGNTVNKYCPYFAEMGLKHVKKMEQGTIDEYTYGESKLKVAVEYCASQNKNKKSNKYFAFDNPKLGMITGGSWELNIYPHLPVKYKPQDVIYTYFIEFGDQVYQGNIIAVKDLDLFTYIHVKTTPIKDTNTDMVYTLDYIPKINYSRNLLKPINKLQQKIAWFFTVDRVYYQDNDVGDAIQNYLKICRQNQW